MSADDPWQLSRISWGSIWAGALVALSLHLVLSLIGVSFGVRPMANYDGGATLAVSTAAGVVWAISSVISLWIGGWIAGRTAGHGYGNVGGMHGIVVWAVVTTALFAFVANRSGAFHWRQHALLDPDVAERAARNLRVIASWSFLVLALGAFSAGWGGRCGARHVATFHGLA